MALGNYLGIWCMKRRADVLGVKYLGNIGPSR